MKTKNIISIIVLNLFLLIGCQNMENRWEDAQSKNTIECYEEFINDFPESQYNEIAKDKIVDLNFNNARNINTIQAYEEFLKQYPESQHTQTAQINIAKLNFQNAKETNTIESFTEFISRYPDASEVEEAKIKIEELKYNEVKQKNSISGFQEFIDQNSQSIYADEARNELINFYVMELNLNNSIVSKEAIENKIIKAIIKNGPGNRFVLAEILPENVVINTIVVEGDMTKNSEKEFRVDFSDIVQYRSSGQSILDVVPNLVEI